MNEVSQLMHTLNSAQFNICLSIQYIEDIKADEMEEEEEDKENKDEPEEEVSQHTYMLNKLAMVSIHHQIQDNSMAQAVKGKKKAAKKAKKQKVSCQLPELHFSMHSDISFCRSKFLRR
jgi:hypothetical protein